MATRPLTDQVRQCLSGAVDDHSRTKIVARSRSSSPEARMMMRGLSTSISPQGGRRGEAVRAGDSRLAALGNPVTDEKSRRGRG